MAAARLCGLRLACCCFGLLVAAAGATQYKVGGDNGWAVPDAAGESFNTWAEKTGFQIGDQLRECATAFGFASFLPPAHASIQSLLPHRHAPPLGSS
jgi:hypothetical protein